MTKVAINGENKLACQIRDETNHKEETEKLLRDVAE